MRRFRFCCATMLLFLIQLSPALIAAEYESLSLLADTNSKSGEIVGPNNQIQLLLLAKDKDGKTVDLTRAAKYSSKPEGIISIDAKTGLVSPLQNGKVEISATNGSMSATTSIEVKHLNDPPPLNFRNDIVPVLTKFSCNSGGCHGKSGGQNGFALSLLGFEPQEDYQYIVKESRGRRVFPASPEESLLLRKATGEVPHGGGSRLKKSSYEYRLLTQWIDQGLPYGSEEDPRLVRISVFPKRASLALDAKQQLKVTAYYSDGSERDVTNQAQFESNNTELSEVSEQGSGQS